MEKEAGSLREYEEEQKVPLAERISERDADLLWQRTATYKADACLYAGNCWLATTPKLRALSARRRRGASERDSPFLDLCIAHVR